MKKATFVLWIGFCALAFPSFAQQDRGAGPGQMTSEQQAAAQARRQAEMNAPRPIAALDSIWMEELTWMEIRDAIKDGKTSAIVLTGGVELNGPYLPTGKHNYALKIIGESIARKLGNALLAPIVTLEPGRPDAAALEAGNIRLSQATYKAVLTEMGDSLRGMGFKNVFYIGDSGSNRTGMSETAAALNAKYQGNPTRFFHIPEYYNYEDVRKLTQASGIPEQMQPTASSGSDGIHDEYSIDAILAVVDPQHVRLDQRKAAGKTTINGVSLLPLEKTLAHGKKIIEFRTKVTVDAINKALSGTKTNQ